VIAEHERSQWQSLWSALKKSSHSAANTAATFSGDIGFDEVGT